VTGVKNIMKKVDVKYYHHKNDNYVRWLTC
jgi:hypothetical protein